MSTRIFVSYPFGDSAEMLCDHAFVLRVSYWMRVQGLRPYVYGIDGTDEVAWSRELESRIHDCEGFVCFVSERPGRTQIEELQSAFNAGKPCVYVGMRRQTPNELRRLLGIGALAAHNAQIVSLSSAAVGDAIRLAAKSILERLAHEFGSEQARHRGIGWFCDDGLPIAGEVIHEGDIVFPFDYERGIIYAYLRGTIDVRTAIGRRLIQLGCPIDWPWPTRGDATFDNNVRVEDIGLPRDRDGTERHVLSGALSRFDFTTLQEKKLYFAEAGPRRKLRYRPGHDNLRFGILVSGGIAPGINAVIAGIAERHCLYANSGHYPARLDVVGLRNGFNALYERGDGTRPLVTMDQRGHCVPLPELASHANEGGSFLGTSRLPDFAERKPEDRGRLLSQAVEKADNLGLKVIYVIGGDGSMKAAHAMSNAARAMGHDLSVVGIPKTMDNDILWVWTSFGFQSAVQHSTDAVRQLWTEASSNPRLCVIQLFGSDSGFVVTDAAAASGKCDLFLVPEQPFTMSAIASHLASRLESENRRYAVVVMAETAVPLDILRYVRDPAASDVPEADRALLSAIGLSRAEREALTKYAELRRLVGPTPDELRSGALKVVSRVLQWELQHCSETWQDLGVLTNEPRHLIRAIPPSSSDIIFARRLAYLAVDGAMAGFRDFMISQWLTEYAMVPLSLVVLGRKRIPIDGAFYANARASTGQPSDLTDV